MALKRPALDGLYATTHTSPEDMDRNALMARADARQGADFAAEDASLADPTSAQNTIGSPVLNRMHALFNRRDVGGQGHAWAPFHEAMQEAGGGQGATIEPGGLEGLPDSGSAMGTVPLSLQGLQGVAYGATPEGRQVAMRYRRGQTNG